MSALCIWRGYVFSRGVCAKVALDVCDSSLNRLARSCACGGPGCNGRGWWREAVWLRLARLRARFAVACLPCIRRLGNLPVACVFLCLPVPCVLLSLALPALSPTSPLSPCHPPPSSPPTRHDPPHTYRNPPWAASITRFSGEGRRSSHAAPVSHPLSKIYRDGR